MFRKHSRISRKLLWLALFNAVAFGVMVVIVGGAFDRVESLSSRIAGDGMTTVIENAAIGRELSATFSEIDLLSRSCHGDASFAETGKRLSASIAGLARKAPDLELQNAITVLSSSVSRLLEECAVTDRTLAGLRRIDRESEAQLTRLEDVISRSLIEHTLAGKRTDHLDQVMSLATGFRETLLLIGKRIAEQSAAHASDRVTGESAEALLDDLALRLQTLTASSPEIARIANRLIRFAAAYRAEAIRFKRAAVRFNTALKTSHEARQTVLGSLKRLDSDASGRVEGVQEEIRRIVELSSREVLGFSVLVALLTLVSITLIIRRSINRPLVEVLEHIEAIRGGAQSPARGSLRNDEWGTIQTALSDMSADLARSNSELHVSRERLELALQGANDGLWDWNLETDEIYLSTRWKSMLGYADDELPSTAETLRQLVDPGQRGRLLQYVDDCVQGRTPVFEIDLRMRHKAGHWVDILSRATLARDAEGRPLVPRRLVGTHVDITERKQAEARLRQAASVFTHAREGIMITGANGEIVDVNEAFTRITGFERDEVLGRNPRLLSSGRHDKEFYDAMWRDLLEQGHWYGELWNRRKNGEIYPEMQTIGAVRDAAGNTQQYVALFSDITTLKEHEQRLEHLANYDALTTLPNRVLLADRLHQAMAQARRRGRWLAVAYLDLDGFKAINDTHGHDTGDRLLVGVAAHMKQALRDGDTLARLGGDEFVAVLLDVPDIEASVPMLARLVAACARPVHVDDRSLRVSASLGVTFYPQADEVDADQLLRQADQAMYQAKLAGKNRFHVFDAEQDRSVRGQHENIERVRRALTAREFVLHYQPKVNMRTGTVIGAEALIRWQHPERGLRPPGEFLPVIEDHPLSIELGEWVIDSALGQMALWHAAGLHIRVSVNVGAYQLQQPDFVDRLSALLAAHPEVGPGNLELEVLETSALDDLSRVTRVIEACRELGVTFALDDFGTGYSSLTYLKRLPVTQIKIDQSFVRDMLDDPDDLAILEGVLGFATAFRLEVIAEGVETVEHGALLLRLGCELAQGYGIARPMPARDLPAWAAAWQPDAAWIDAVTISRDDLPLLFAGAEHRAWIAAMESHLRGERDGAPPLDWHRCRFGMWLDTNGRARHGGQPSFEAIDRLHRRVHTVASELCELQASGRDPEAMARLGELRILRDGLLEQLQALVREDRQEAKVNLEPEEHALV
jgi:diguanylate cyclase (GGDEF)-like protein/PAS domain S-box-containing protein